MKRIVAALAALAVILIGLSSARAADPENTLYLDLQYGRVVIEMRPDLAPNHVARIKELARQGFYDGVPFHRVIEGFMAQTGDPTGTGTGGSGQELKAEFSNEPHVRGTVSMARAQDPDSADSQFFICLADARFLDGKYTVWGEVVEGMEFVDQIQKGDSADNGIVPEDDRDKIIKMQVAADAK
jgi:peptidylprolyl isomerase